MAELGGLEIRLGDQGTGGRTGELMVQLATMSPSSQAGTMTRHSLVLLNSMQPLKPRLDAPLIF